MPPRPLAIALLLLAIVAQSSRAFAQEPASDALAPATGSIEGQVANAATAAPLQGVRVILTFPAPTDDSEPHEEVTETDVAGNFEFKEVAPASYSLEFVKQGFGTATLKNFIVHSGQVNRADQRMAEGSDAVEPAPDVEEILVLGARVEAIEASRQESDEMINTLSAEEISKFAATDVADVILRLPGVNVVEGQFAIIRGLEDRYSSTLFNSAPIPSPDPTRQSPQLDLFANEIVDDLVVAKTFAPDLPSNSSGGSINILTQNYTDEEIHASAKAKSGFNTHAADDFLALNSGSPIGDPEDGLDVVDQEYGASFGGRSEVGGHELRLKGLFNWGQDFKTAEGFQEKREPRSFAVTGRGDLAFGDLSLTSGRFDLTTSDQARQTTAYGGLGFDLDEAGDHRIDFSVFYTQKQVKVVDLRENGFFPGFDYSGVVQLANDNNEVPFSYFDGTTRAESNGTFTSWMSRSFSDFRKPQEEAAVQTGALFFSSFQESRSFDIDRDLLVTQLNGDHGLDALLEGLKLRWAGNYAATSQDEEDLGTRYFFEPCGFSQSIPCPAGVSRIAIPTVFPVTVGSLGPGRYAALSNLFRNTNNIDETQYFGRGDADYERELTDWLTATASTGLWYEHAKRDIEASYLAGGRVGAACQNPGATTLCTADAGGQVYAIFGDTAQELGENIFSFALARRPDGEFDSTVKVESDAKREIEALNLNGKGTLWEQLDLIGGVRLEKIHIESNNDPFQPGQMAFDLSPLIFPGKYVLFDRMDNAARNEKFPPVPPFNNQILGIDVPVGPCRNLAGNVIPGGGQCVDFINRAELQSVINGEIDENKVLPAVGVNYRPIEGLALRSAWSRTVARPSFREMGYYVTVEPASDDLIVGNPQLQLSDVESVDGRVEYFFGDHGDLVAASAFYKTIEKPIESIIVRDAGIFNEASDALFRTFFNNENTAHLWGIELEARKYLDFVGPEFLEYFSLGANFTWIDAKVDRSELERQRAAPYFRVPPGSNPAFTSLNKSRRLFGQPEWIVNADLSFDHPDWGTKVTLAFFGISDVLDAAGTAFIANDNQLRSMTLDRYIDSFSTLDLVVSQKIWEGLAVKFQAKNLTNSRRDIVYDGNQTLGKFEERSYKLGQSFSFELSYSFDGDLPRFGE